MAVKKKTSAFDWIIRLLTSILAIAVIASFITPFFGRVAEPSRLTQATQQALQLKQAIATYYVEYRRWPYRTEDTLETFTLSSDTHLMDTLLGSESEAGPDGMNPMQIAFFAGRKARSSPDGGYRLGVKFNSDDGGELFDPWGNHYRVRLDFDGDGKIPAPDWDAPGNFIEAEIIVWSPGPDGDDNTKTHNATTW